MLTSMKPGAVISYIACALGRNNQWIRCGYRRLYSSNGVRSGRRNPFLSKESGGGVKTLPLFYDKYKKRPYMRRDHPNRHGAVDPEARNVHVSSSAFENAASFQESGTDKGASKSTGTASSDFVSGEHEPPSYQGEMEPARGGEIGKGKRSMQSHSSLSNSSRKKSMWTVADRQAQVRKRERRLLSESVLWSNQVLTSRSTSFVRHVRLLQSNEGYRTSQRKVVLTGKRVIEDLAAKMRVHPEILLLREGRKCPDSLTPRIDQISVSTATKAVLEEVDPGNDGYVAVYGLPQPSPKELLFVPPSTRATSLRHVLLLDNVQDPSCVGTLMRTAVAMCYDAVVLVNHCADLYHAATIRAARGVHFQEQTKFFVLKEEDGDDSMEIINQTIEVHGLEPLLYSLRNQIHGTRMPPKKDSPVLNAQHAVMGASFTLESTSVTRPGLHNVDPRELHDVSMTTMSFTGLERQRTDAYSGAPRSPLIIVGEDATQSLVRKYQTRLRNPTRSVIELEPNEDDAESALQVSVPLLLHALRPMAVAESGEYHPKQIASGVDAPSGPSRRDDVHQPDWDRYQSWLTRSDAGFERTAPNIVGEEAIRDHFEGFYFEKMQQRYRQYLKTDAELYEEKERIRILREARREQEEMELAHAAPPQEPASVGKERVSRYPSPMDSLQVVPTREDVRALATEQIAYRLPSRYARYTRK